MVNPTLYNGEEGDVRRVLISLAYLVGFFVLAYLVVEFLLPYLWPFLLAFLIAVFIDPPVNFAQNRLKIPRQVAVLCVMIAVAAFLGMLLTLTLSRLILELSEIQALFPSFYEKQIATIISELVSRAGEFSRLMPAQINAIISRQLALVQSWLETAVNLLWKVPNMLGAIIITLISAYFISRDKESIEKIIVNMLPKSLQKQVAEAQGDVIKSTVQLIEIQALIVVFTTIVVILCLKLANVKYSLVLGLLSGLLDVIPIIGPSLLFVPWAIFSLWSGSVGFGIYLLVIYAVMAVGRELLTIRVVGITIGLHPLSTLVGLYVGARVFGPKGLVIGPLLAIILKALVVSGAFPPFTDKRT